MLPLFVTLVLASGTMMAVQQSAASPDSGTVYPSSIAFGEIDHNCG